MRIATVFLAFLCAAALSAATPLGTGMRMPAFTLADQHDVQGSVRPDTRCVLFSRDMSAANVVKEALANDPIERVKYVESADALRAALRQAAAPPRDHRASGDAE